MAHGQRLGDWETFLGGGETFASSSTTHSSTTRSSASSRRRLELSRRGRTPPECPPECRLGQWDGRCDLGGGGASARVQSFVGLRCRRRAHHRLVSIW